MARELTEQHIAAHPVIRARTRWRVSAEHSVLVAIYVLALVRGLLYVTIIPPWEHYDEPTHFEYAALIAAHGTLPDDTTVDAPLRNAIARSMQTHSTWGPRHVPSDDSNKAPPTIGVVQVGHSPLYYILAALPIRLSMGAPIEIQLYSMRSFSVILYLLTIALAGWWLKLALPAAPTLRLTVLGLIATTPSFGALMSAASNDVLTSLTGVGLLLLSALVVRAGWSWRAVAFAICGIALPFLVKRTILSLALVPLLALIMTLPPRTRRWFWRGLALALGIVCVVLALSPTGSNYWVTSNNGHLKSATATTAHDGQRALLLTSAAADHDGVGQPLAAQAVYAIRGEHASIGVWTRALTGTVQVQPPLLVGVQSDTPPPPITLDQQWRFVSSIVKIPDTTWSLELHFSPPLNAGTVVYDSAVVVKGKYPNGAPSWQGDSQQGAWNNASVLNLLRNPSMEQQGLLLQLPQPLEQRIRAMLPESTMSLVISSVWDWRFIRDVYPALTVWLFRTFWMVTGRGLLLTPTDTWTWVLAALAMGAIVGGLLAWIKHIRSVIARRKAHHASRITHHASPMTLLLCGVAACLAWGTAFVRVYLQPEAPSALLYFPVGRYAFGGFVPTVVLLVLGLAALVPRRWHTWMGIALMLVWMALDVSAMTTIVWYYYVAR